MKSSKGKSKKTIANLASGVETKETEIKRVGKELGPKTKGSLVVLRTIFWIVLCLILLLGVYQIIVSKRPRVVENVVKYDMSIVEGEKAKGLAQAFAQEYLTIDKTIKDYDQRVGAYLAPGMLVSKPRLATGSSAVERTIVYDLIKIDDANSDVYVQVDVKIQDEQDLQETYAADGSVIKAPKIFKETYYLSIPITASDGKLIIAEYPRFVTEPDKATVAGMVYYTKENPTASDLMHKEIKKMLEGFLEVYYTGSDEQIKQFFKGDYPKGLNGEFVYSSIKELNVFETATGLDVVTLVEIRQAGIDTAFYQRFKFVLEKTGERWTITDMTNRIN